MIIQKNSYNNLCLFDNNKKAFETDYIGAEFIIVKLTDKPIIITENDDKYLYNNLVWLLNNKYAFNNNGLSYMIDNKIVWFSDQSCNINNKEETDKIDRIIIEKCFESIKITSTNPFCKKNSIKKIHSIISFSPSGNGFYSKNLVTDKTFQDDFIIAIQKAIINEYIGKTNPMIKRYKK